MPQKHSFLTALTIISIVVETASLMQFLTLYSAPEQSFPFFTPTESCLVREI
ncbi:MAG: hypothetical protein AAFQ80_17700 [Cyanobacteria bacterium J06621_8]